MAENSKIEWTHHTFNPWVGCTKISPACDHCYAEGWAKRTGNAALWQGARRHTSVANWRQPVLWNKRAGERGVRERVFCASLADVWDNQVPHEWRIELFALIRATPNLDWLLLTKRPQNIAKMLPIATVDFLPFPWPNVWLGTTVENQDEADKRIPHLLRIPAALHFLSCEPLLSPLNLGHSEACDHVRYSCEEVGCWSALDWIICGGESGASARTMDPEWARALRDGCDKSGIAFFMKQMTGKAPIPGDLMVRQFPEVRSA